MLADTEIIHLIDDAILSIWTNEIKEDYNAGWLLKEDTLKNALYFHLRNKLGWIFEENDIRIFTEFTDWKYKQSGYKPDMVIAKVDVDRDVKYWGDAITECLAVIELKFKTGYSPIKDIYADYDKLQDYVESLEVGCKLYMATIWEYEDDPTTWIRKNAAWAKGKVTELNASYERGFDYKMRFYIHSH